MKQIKPKVLTAETRAIIATGSSVVRSPPGSGSELYGDGKYPSGPGVACGTREGDEMDIVLVYNDDPHEDLKVR